MDPNLPSKYEELGLAALVRAGEARNWFTGHFGAALIAGGALLRDPAMPGEAIVPVLDRLVAKLPDWFRPLEDLGDLGTPTSLDDLVTSLAERIGTARTSGHPTIYAVAGLRALARAPERVTTRIVDGLVALHQCTHTDDERGRYYGIDDYFTADVNVDDVPELPDLESAFQEAFRACRDLVPDADVDGRRHFFAGEKIHLVTHAHALDCLDELGYAPLARAGLVSERIQLKLTVTPDCARKPVPEPSSLTPQMSSFWDHDGADVFHKLKLAEAAYQLLPKIPPQERPDAERCLGLFWSLFGVDQETKRH